MKRLHVAVGGLVLVTCGLSVLLGYRLGRHSSGAVITSPLPASPGATETAGCVDFHDAGAHTGQTGCVSGRVLRVFTSRAGNTFLDFCPDYRDCPFSSVIFSSDREHFGDLSTLTGRNVELRGPIGLHQGRAQIILHDSEQIHVVP